MKVELFIQDKELGIEFDMKFDTMDALSSQVFNITAIVDRAKRDKSKAEAPKEILCVPLGQRPPKPVVCEGYHGGDSM